MTHTYLLKKLLHHFLLKFLNCIPRFAAVALSNDLTQLKPPLMAKKHLLECRDANNFIKYSYKYKKGSSVLCNEIIKKKCYHHLNEYYI